MDGLGDEGDGEAIRLPTAEYLAPSAQQPNCPDKADMGAYGAACTNEATKSGVKKHLLKDHFVYARREGSYAVRCRWIIF